MALNGSLNYLDFCQSVYFSRFFQFTPTPKEKNIPSLVFLHGGHLTLSNLFDTRFLSFTSPATQRHVYLETKPFILETWLTHSFYASTLQYPYTAL